MICSSCRNEFLSGTCLTCGVHDLLAAEREYADRELDAARLTWARAGITVGRIETLRMIYIGSACASVFYGWAFDDRYASADDPYRWDMAADTAEEHAGVALEALAALGEPTAIAALRGGS